MILDIATLELVIAAILAVNVCLFLLYGYDKRQACRDGWRIPEKTLLLWSCAGPFGAIAGMGLFRHKTQKMKFALIVPGLAILQLIAAAAIVMGFP
jgi:uncharacterized membrane protein YsdA (DUF1294 family)